VRIVVVHLDAGIYFISRNKLKQYPDLYDRRVGLIEFLRLLRAQSLGDVAAGETILVTGLEEAITLIDSNDLQRLLLTYLQGRGPLLQQYELRVVFRVTDLRTNLSHYVVDGGQRMELEWIFGTGRVSEIEPGIVRAQPI
jgi:hypothetical protein